MRNLTGGDESCTFVSIVLPHTTGITTAYTYLFDFFTRSIGAKLSYLMERAGYGSYSYKEDPSEAGPGMRDILPV
jgi:hypothetical protein